MVKVANETDEQLIARMARKEQEALSSFYDRHRSLVFTLALRILGDRAEAEEILIEVFHQAWRSAGIYDTHRGSAPGWLINLCRSRAIDRKRALASREETDEQASPPPPPAEQETHPPGPEDQAEIREQRERVAEILSLLPAEQRAAIETAYYGGLSRSEISGELDESLPTIKTRIGQGLKALRANFSASFVP